MNLHLFKNESEMKFTEIKQRKIIQSLNDILIFRTKRNNNFISRNKENNSFSSEKNKFYISEIQHKSNNNIITLLNSDNPREKNKSRIVKKLNKLHSSRSEMVISKDKIFNNNNTFGQSMRNQYYQNLNKINYTFRDKKKIIKTKLEKIKQNRILLPKNLNKKENKIKLDEDHRSEIIERYKYLTLYDNEEIEDDTSELKKNLYLTKYITPEFEKTNYSDKSSFNIFFQKSFKDTEIVRKGGKSHQTPSFNLIRATKKLKMIPNPICLLKKAGDEENLNLKNKVLGDDYIKCLNESLKVSKHISVLNLEKNRLSDMSLIPLMQTILDNNNLLEKLLEINLSYNKIGIGAIELLVRYILEHNCNLENLNLESNSIGVTNTKKIVEAISTNLKHEIKYLNLSKNLLNDDIANDLSILINNCDSLNVLILYQNQFTNQGAGILMSEIKKHTGLKILDLSWNLIGTNLTDEVPTLDELIKSKNNINNDSNEINHFDNAYLNELKYTLKYRRYNSTSPERKGSKVSYFTSQLCGLFHNKKTELLHLDISYNNLNYIDCKAISEHIKNNHTILGIHVDGNDMYTDEFGFVYPIQKSNYKQDHFAKSQIFYRLSDEHPLIISNAINLNKVRAKNNCWICEGWREIKFNYKPPISSEEDYEQNYVKLYLNFENYKNINLNELNYIKDGNNSMFQCYRVCPPGELYFFLSRNGAPITNYGIFNHYLKDTLIFTEDSKPIKYADEKIEDNKKKLKKFIITKVAHKTIEINSEVIDPKRYINQLKYCVPRPKYKLKIIERENLPWNFSDSIWSWYGYDIHGESEYNAAFEFDFDRCDFDKEKDLLDNEKDKLREIIRKRYKKILDTYKHLSAYLGWKIWQIGQNQITQFAQTCKDLIDNKYLINDFLVKVTEVKYNYIDKLERKNNPNIPENIIRHQFMLLMVKIAKDKYFKTKQIEKLSDAVEYAFTNNYDSYLNNFDINKWRVERYYLEEIDNFIKAHMPIFNALFYSYAPQQIIGRKDSYWLTLDNFTDFCSVLLDPDFPIKDLPVIFNISKKLIKDEIHSDKQYNMIFPEFLEAICRFIDKLSPFPINEDSSEWNMKRRQSQSLLQKLENIIPKLVTLIKEKYKNVKDKFILPIKDKETGKYIINYENPFYKGLLPIKDKK